MTTMDFRGPGPYQHPHRKPIPTPGISTRHDLRPLSKIVPDVDFTASASSSSQQHASANPAYSAYPPRTSSQAPNSSPSMQQQQNNPAFTSRRTPSQSTASTSNTGFTPSRTPSNVSSAVSRTSSTRSGSSASPSSYVALMRKQKATVWCDRAQHEDPRIVAQQKAAKIRAAREITGKTAEGRASMSGSMGSGSLGVRSKIRHHGLPKASGYTGGNMVGGGVPMRLSANEVGDEGTYNGNPTGATTNHHQRTSSARSAGSGNRYLSIGSPENRFSSGSTPTSGHVGSPNENIQELEETPVPGGQPKSEYFPPVSAPGGSGSSSERESSFGQPTKMEAPPAKHEGKSEDELRRRGSVDERANTMDYMGGGRLFVANPDLSD